MPFYIHGQRLSHHLEHRNNLQLKDLEFSVLMKDNPMLTQRTLGVTVFDFDSSLLPEFS